jgi:hypothetical protein
MGNWLLGLAIGFVSLIVLRYVVNWLRFRGERVITCPENHQPAGVTLDAGRAVTLGSFRLSACSRWPEHAGCGQECLAQIAESPQSCLVRNILAEWYRDKTCASCRRPFGDIEWAAQKPALMLADKSSVEWSRIPADKLQETLQTALPVCFACHMANTLVREHPDLAVDRSRRISV